MNEAPEPYQTIYRSRPMTDYDWTNVEAAWHHWHHGVCLSPETPESAARRLHDINTVKPESERPERLLRFRPADLSSIPDLAKAYAAWNKADAAWTKADAARRQAYAAGTKANAAWAKAYAAWNKADAAGTKANAARRQAYAAWNKADAAWAKAYAAWNKADAARTKADAARRQAYAAGTKAYAANYPAILALHAEQCGCRWTPESPSIFENDHE
jgi:hypothetical protein